MRKALLASLFLVMSLLVQAQLSEKGIPPSFDLPALQAQSIDIRTMPAIPITKLHQEDAQDALDGLPPRFGHPFQQELNLENAGTWTKMPNGDKLWRLAIECPGATSINLLYDKFRLPDDARLFIYNKDKSHQIGAFTARNNKEDGKFGTGLVFGDYITLEYHLPKTARYNGELEISTIVHGYKDIDLTAAKNFGDAAPCNIDVNCDSIGRQGPIKSVALMLLGGIRWCTGSLINNVDEDCRPLFLTANSCLFDYDAVDNPKASNFTFYWRYESPTCDGIEGPINETTTGAVVLANASATTNTTSGSNFALLELVENPSDSYDVYFAGWDADGATPSGAYAVHHPIGDVKKIAVDNDQLFESSFGGTPLAHWWVIYWESGVMQDGSYGAPLFLQSNGRIVGQYTLGTSNCGASQDDHFGKFSYSWLNNGATEPRRRLKDWLDPSNIGTTAIDGTAKPCNPRPIISFVNTDLSTKEKTVVDNGCLAHEIFTVELQTTAAPQVPIAVTLNITGEAIEGAAADFEVQPKSLVFPAGSAANQSFTIKVLDDGYIEAKENFEITYTLSTTGRGVSSQFDTKFSGAIIDDDLPPSLNGPSTPINLVVEDFEDGMFPPNWTKSTLGIDSMAFKYGTASDIGADSSFFTVNPINSTNMVGSNDDECNCDMSDDRLISPVFDLSDPSYGAANVEYEVYFEGLPYQGFEEHVEVYATNDAGANWVQIDNVPGVGADGPWQLRTADLSAFLGDAAVQVAFRYTDSGGFLFGVAFDNIRIYAEDRGPTDIQVPDNPVSFDEEYLGPNTTVYFYDETTNHLMLSIENLSSHDYGCVEVRVDRSGSDYSAKEFNSTEVSSYLASKTFLITPENNNPTGNYKATFYYTEAEVAGWESFTGQNRDNIQIVKANTNISNITPSTAGTYTIENQSPITSTYTNSTLGTDFGYAGTFATGFSGFGLGVYEPLLPVSVTFFRGEKLRNSSLLEWETETEVSNAYFTLDRSPDGINFTPIAKIDGAGNSITPKLYQYVDERPLAGKNYYRLSQTDFDGKTTVVDMVLVEFNDLSPIEIYPNPVKNQLDMVFLGVEDAQAEAEVFDAAGRLIQIEKFVATEGINNLALDLENHAAGVYLVKLRFGLTIKVRRFVKL